ncbi:urease accessory UreF family protein [Cereibacter sp. SYSU M97828]|nr:urease accessory UreF family protein [Cereibacter flavus]
MNTDLLRLVQWLSPAFPTGGYAYSHGLEWAIAQREVADARSAGRWIGDVLRFGAGRTDAILLAHALRGADLLALTRALFPSAERRMESETQGAAFATAAGVDPQPLVLAFAQAARTLSVEHETVVALYLYSFAANLCSAATRFVPLGQTEGQRILGDLHPLIGTLARDATVASLDAIGSAAFRGDLASMQHETLDVRIFRT